MPTYSFTSRLADDFATRRLRADVLAGLSAPPRTFMPSWLYDKVGSELFEQITRLPEYYPTRCEREILSSHAEDAVTLSGCDTVVELGSGSSLKTHLLLDALVGAAERPSYYALDVSEDALRQACERLVRRYPSLAVHAIRADFTEPGGQLSEPQGDPGAQRLVAFLGGTIGNFETQPRQAFLASLRASMRPGDHLLLGADLVKSANVLVPAYDDAAGVTAAFDLNVLEVLNRALEGDFAREDFRHRAFWNEHEEWIEMRLQAQRTHAVTLAALDLRLEFAAGEEIRTEVSAKFRRDRLTGELTNAGFSPVRWWTDRQQWFSLSLWAAVTPSPVGGTA